MDITQTLVYKLSQIYEFDKGGFAEGTDLEEVNYISELAIQELVDGDTDLSGGGLIVLHLTKVSDTDHTSLGFVYIPHDPDNPVNPDDVIGETQNARLIEINTKDDFFATCVANILAGVSIIHQAAEKTLPLPQLDTDTTHRALSIVRAMFGEEKIVILVTKSGDTQSSPAWVALGEVSISR